MWGLILILILMMMMGLWTLQTRNLNLLKQLLGSSYLYLFQYVSSSALVIDGNVSFYLILLKSSIKLGESFYSNSNYMLLCHDFTNI